MTNKNTPEINKIPPTILNFTEEDEEIFRKLEDPNYEGFRLLNPRATELEKMKYKLCDYIVKFQFEKKLSDEEMTKRLLITAEKLKIVCDHQYERLTFDELATYAENLAASEQAKFFSYFQPVMYQEINSIIRLKI